MSCCNCLFYHLFDIIGSCCVTDAVLFYYRVSAAPVSFMSIPEQAAVNKSDLGPEVNVTIVVSIVGISSIVPGAVLDITWPLRYHSTGDFLLYPAGVVCAIFIGIL